MTDTISKPDTKAGKNWKAANDKHRDKMREQGYVYRTFCIHSSIVEEIKSEVKTKNKEIASKIFLNNLAKVS